MPGMLANWTQKARWLKQETHAIYLASIDPRTPRHAKIFAACIAAYAFSPIDLIPDPIPILGYLDDLILIPLGIAIVIKMIPSEVLQECREKAQIAQQAGKPRNWIAGSIIIGIWILVFIAAIIFIRRIFPD